MSGSMEVVIAFFLTISLASERLVAIAKTAWPWLAKEKLDAAQLPDEEADRLRRLVVHAVAFGACYVSAAVATNLRWPFDIASIGNYPIPLLGVALLATGGSAFWNNILGYTKAAKGNQQALQEANALRLRGEVSSAVDRVEEVTTRRIGEARSVEVRAQLRGTGQPPLRPADVSGLVNARRQPALRSRS